MLFSRLKQWFSRSETPKRAAGSSDQDVALLHHRFKLFLTAWNNFQETMTELDWAWRNSIFDVFLKSGMVNFNVKPQ